MKNFKEFSVDLDEAKVSAYKDMGATSSTTHFIKNITTGKIVSPHRSHQDAQDALVGTEQGSSDKFKIVRAVKEEVELDEGYGEGDIATGGTVIYKHEGKHVMSKVSHKTGGGAGTKIHTIAKHVVPLHHIVSTDASDWNHYKLKEEVVSEAMPGSLSKSDYTPGARKSLKDTEKTSKFKVATNAVGGHKEQQVEVDATSKNHALNQAAEHFAKKGLKPRVHFDGLRIKEEVVAEGSEEKGMAAYRKGAHDAHNDKEETNPYTSGTYDHGSYKSGYRIGLAHKDKKQGVAESAICSVCDSDPCICDDSHGFVSEAAQAKHRVGVTVSEKDHPMVSKRLEKQQKFVKVSAASKEEAVARAKKFYSKQGYHVHGAEHHSVSEEVKSSSVPSFKEFIA